MLGYNPSPALATLNVSVHEALFQPLLDEGSVDLALFSPPYFLVDGWSPQLMRDVGTVLGKVLKPGGRAFMVFGPTREGLLRPFESAKLVLDTSGCREGQTIIWVKSIAVDGKTSGHYQPSQSNQLLHNGFEYIFQFVKHPNHARNIDPIAVGVPFSDLGNLKRGNRGRNGNLHSPGDVWFCRAKTTGKKAKKWHKHEFPLELATKILKLSNLTPKSTVVDFFSGGGTTAVAAGLLGHNAVVVDISPEAIETTKRRWSEEVVSVGI